MAERTEIDCQKTYNDWFKSQQGAFHEIESLCQDKPFEQILIIARSSSYRAILSLSELGANLDLLYAAQAHGRLSWLSKTISDQIDKKVDIASLSSDPYENNCFQFEDAITHLAMLSLRSFFLIKNFPLKPEDQEQCLKTLKKQLVFIYDILENYSLKFPYEFSTVYNDLLSFSQSRIAELTYDPDFDLQMPFLSRQKITR